MPAPRPRDDRLLKHLLFKVNQARAEVRADRAPPASATSSLQRRHRYAELADALEAYASAAEASGVPLSYRYRDEMRLCRSVARHPSERPVH